MSLLQEYQRFSQLLLNCQKIFTLLGPQIESSCLDIAALQQTMAQFPASVAELQQLAHQLQHQLLIADLAPATVQTITAFQVEINKQLQLLKVDTLFLRSAKQATTIAQRLAQIQQRFNLLEKYVTAILTQLTAA